MADKVWAVEYKQHQIRVINKVSFSSSKRNEILEIDGVEIDRVQGSMFRICSTIFAKYKFAGVEQEVEVRIAQKNDFSDRGCQIFIDEQKVGGDSSIQYPNPQDAAKHMRNGFLQYSLSQGLLIYGLPFGIVQSFLHPANALSEKVVMFLLSTLSFGFCMSFYMWTVMKQSLNDRQKARQKLARQIKSKKLSK